MKLIAHGGFPKKYKENTLEGYLAAASFMPFAIEMDIILDSSTGLPICYHPEGVSSEQGVYSSQTSTNITNVVFLKDVIEKIPEDIKILLDLKQDSDELIQKIFEEIPVAERQRIIIGTRNIQTFKTIKSLDRSIETLALFSSHLDFQEYSDLGGKYFRLWEKDVTKDLVMLLHKSGLEAWVTPGNKGSNIQPRTAGEVTRESFDTLLTLGVDTVLVNDIETVTNWNTQ